MAIQLGKHIPVSTLRIMETRFSVKYNKTLERSAQSHDLDYEEPNVSSESIIPLSFQQILY